MNLVFNISMFISFYLVLPIMYVTLKNEAAPKKNIVLGVTLPYEARQDNEVLDLTSGYKRLLNMTAIILTLLIVPATFIQYESLSMAYYLTWLPIALCVMYLPYILYHKKIKALKAHRCWSSPLAGLSVVDVAVVMQPKKLLGQGWFIPPAILCIAPLVYTGIFNADKPESALLFILLTTNVLMVLIFYVCYRIIYRQRAEIIDENTSLSLALTNLRTYNWSKFWIFAAWLTSAFSMCCLLLLNNTVLFIVITMIYTVAILIVAMNAEFSTRKAQQDLTKESGKRIYKDDDDHWIFGTFYYNPHDNHLIVNSRIGMSTTVNLAKTAGKILMGLTVVCIVGLPFLGIWMGAEEFTPVRLEVTADKVIGYHTSKAYEVDIASIQSVELLDTMPRATRIFGSGFTNLAKGKFQVSSVGVCRVLLNPNRGPFIVIKTDANIYMFGTNNREDTLAVYSELIGR